MGREQGVTEEKLMGLAAFEESDIYSEMEVVALRLATAMVQTSVEVSNELYAELKRHFDDAQIVELTSALAWENYRARFNHALKIGSEGFSEGMFCPIPIGHLEKIKN